MARNPENVKAARRRHYYRNKGAYISRALAQKEARRNLLDSIKRQPCKDCGQAYPPCVMDFDHVRGKKLFNISREGMSCSLSSLQEELTKCDVVCANCHRLRTYNGPVV